MDNKKKPSEAQSLGSSVMAVDPRLDIPTTAERLTKPLKDIKSTFITKFERLSTLIDDTLENDNGIVPLSLCGTTSSKNREGGGANSDNAKSMPMPINDISTESTELNTSDERSFDLPTSSAAIGEQQAGGSGGEGTDTSFGFGSWLASQQFDASAIISPNNNLSSVQQEDVNNNKWDNNSQYSREIKEDNDEQQSQDGYVSIADVTNSGNSHTRNNIVNVILDKVNCSNGNSAWQCWNNDTTTSSTSKVKKSKIVTPTKKKKTHRRCASPSILKKDSSFVVDQHGVSLGRAKSEGHTTSQTEQTLKKSLSWAEDKKNIVAHGVEMGVAIEKELVGSSKSGHIAGEEKSVATASITAGSMTDQELSPKEQQPVCWPSALDTPSRSDIKKNTPQSPDLSEASSYTGRVVQNIKPQTIALTSTDISASLAGEDLVSEAQSFPEGCASTAQTSLAYSASPAKHPFGGKIEARPFSSPAVAAMASPRTSNPLAQTDLFDNNPQFTSGLIDVQQPQLEEEDENDAQPLLTTVTSSDSNDQVPVVRRSLANKGRSRRRMRLTKK